VGGREQDTINVKNACGQGFGMVGPWSSWLEDGHNLMHSELENGAR